MLLITSALSGFVLIWGINSITSSNQSYSSSLKAQNDRFGEILIIEDAAFLSDISVNIFLRNAGSELLVVDKIYVNSTVFNSSRITLGGQGNGNVSANYMGIEPDFFSIGESYQITVVTSRGVKASGDFIRT